MPDGTQSVTPLRYVALGDSYTIGVGASGPEAAFPARLAALIGDRLGRQVEVTNPAVDGYTTQDLIREELPLLEPIRPDLVTVLIGANDLAQGWSVETYRFGVRAIYDTVRRAVREADAVLVVSVPDWSLAEAAARFGTRDRLRSELETRNAVAREEAGIRGFRWFDLTELSRQFGVAGLSDDGMHPGDAQYAAWAEAIWASEGPAWVGSALAQRSAGAPPFGEASAHLDYGTYLRVPELLQLQSPRTGHHDELLFIVVHQAYELWFRLVLHELEAARDAMLAGDLSGAAWDLRRVVAIERLLVQQVDVLDTMAPQDFLAFRSELTPASGFQSVQFREIEFLSGLGDPSYLARLETDQDGQARLERRLREATLRDAFAQVLAQPGAPALPELLADRRRHPDLYALAEALLEHDQQVGIWRARHVVMVERQIGSKAGTGGSSGASYLRTTLDKRFFPELWAARSELGGGAG
ncbi:MAG: tryptophan 2,3-dioxygenase family protein [Candidatus Dormiibacterota bacterium]